MDITYLGGGSVKLTGRGISLISDPAGSATADVVLLTDTEASKASSATMTIDGPGEYEVKGAMITGVPVRRHIDEAGDNATMYSVELDDFNVAILGNIAPELSDKQQEELGQVDVLVVPVGGKGLTLDSVAAAKIVSLLEPKFVVPVHFDDGVSKYAMPQDGVDTFLKEMGVKSEPQPKLKLSSKELPMETTVVVLQPQKS